MSGNCYNAVENCAPKSIYAFRTHSNACSWDDWRCVTHRITYWNKLNVRYYRRSLLVAALDDATQFPQAQRDDHRLAFDGI